MAQGLATSSAPRVAASKDEDPEHTEVPAHSGLPGWAVVGGLTVMVAVVPLATALVALASPRLYPVMDLAETELRVRDVGTSHRPLIGLGGRFYGIGFRGSHPGPLSFYTLWPVYRLTGGTGFGLHLATIVSNVAAVAVAMWIAYRRRGPMLALGVAAALAVLVRGAGVTLFIEAWNPYLPVLWWVVFMLAVWSVLCADIALLPVAVFAGSYCMQTHISYVGLVPGGALLAVGALVVLAVKQRRDRAALVRLSAWTIGSVAFALLLWAPPIIDQLQHQPSNLDVLRESFAHPGEPSVGLGQDAVRFLLSYLDPWGLLSDFRAPDLGAYDGIWPVGLVVLVLWVATAVVAWRRRAAHPDLARLHLVVAVTLGLGLVSISRIHAQVRHYLLLWEWATAVPLAVATGWTLALVWREHRPAAVPRGASRLPRAAVAGLAAVTLVAAAQFTWQGAHEEVQAARETAVLARLAPPTIAALRSGEVPGGGEDGRYLVRWGDDQEGFGVGGIGMLNELERQGFEAGAIPQFATAVDPRRVLELDEATATVNYVLGTDMIEKWRAIPGAVEVAYVDLRSNEERARFDRLHDQVIAAMIRAGLEDQAAAVDQNLWIAAFDPDLPPEIAEPARALYDLGLPAAVFVAPPEAG
jgi:hypothetical protein